VDATQPFVGRRAEVGLLLGRLAAADGGRGGVVLVSGPAGIGKTRLVEEALARHGGTAAVGRGVCSDDRGAPPLWPWARALRAVGRLTGMDPAAALRPPAADPGATAEPAAAAAERFRRLTAATDALLQAAADRPVVLVLDDLHWADAESLELLRRVATEAGSASLLVLGTLRDALPDDVAVAVADVRRSAATAAVPLGPLSRVDVGDYLRAAGAAAVDAPEVHRRTGGLPLLLAAAASDVDGAAEGDLQLVVAGLLGRLGPDDRRVVEVLALLGAPAAEPLLAEVSGMDGAAVAAGLRAGRRAGLLGRAAEDGVPFAHTLLQDGVRRAAPATAAAGWHRRAAEVLAARVPADPGLAGEVAAHWRRAGGDPDSARQAAGFAELAADHAERSLALDDAVRHLQDAAGSLRVAGAGDAETARLLVRLATAEFLAGRMGDSLARCEAAGRAADRAGRPDLVAAAALVLRGVTNAQVGAVVERLCRAALGADPPDATRARLLAQLATVAADAGRPDEAAALAVEALGAAEAAGDPIAVVDAARAREMTLLRAGDEVERLRLGRLAVDLGERVGQPLAAVLGAGWQLRAGYELGRIGLVDEAYAVLARLAERSGQPLARWHHLRALAARAALEGRYPYARECNAAATALAAGFADISVVGMSYAHATCVAILRGDPGDLLDGTLEMVTAAPPMPLIRSQHACLLLLLDRGAEAYGIYEVLRAELATLVEDLRWAPTLFNLVELAVAFDDAPTAEALAARLRPWRDCAGAAGIHTAYFGGSPLYDLGRLARLAGRLDEAAELLVEAARRNLAVRARPHVALSRLELAGVRHRQGALDEAGPLVRQAADDFRRLEMPGPLRRADRLAAAVAAARRDADPLSDRERQVRDLVVRALSNRDIAAELVLSERTVESHVRSILAKLGCANRSELIARHAAGR
jgi:DNA-binding NarL/FixJ family response regulator